MINFTGEQRGAIREVIALLNEHFPIPRYAIALVLADEEIYDVITPIVGEDIPKFLQDVLDSLQNGEVVNVPVDKENEN